MLNKKVLLLAMFFGCLLYSVTVHAQARIVRGKITTADGPMPGVSIVQKGTTNGTISDSNGGYVITMAPGSEILVFSFIGYQTLEQNMAGKTEADIELETGIKGLDEVVVVGYGTEKRRDVTGSISSINSEDLKDNVFTSFAQTLQGRAAGVQVTEASGEPGGAVSVNIRGTNSLSGSNQPLYILDGIPLGLDAQGENDQFWTGSNPLASLNPNDIESIEILKDASATAIYGSRASNGVVLITTKSAIPGTSKIEASLRTSISSAGEPYGLMNAAQYNEVRNYFVQLNNPTKSYDQLVTEKLLPYQGQTPGSPFPADAGEGTDFMQELFRKAVMQSYSVSLSGGTEKFSQLLSLNFDNQEGVIIDSKFLRGNLRYNSKMQLAKRFTLNTNVQINYSQNQRVLESARTGLSGVTFMAMRINPNIPLRGEDGELTDVDESGNFITNPYTDALDIDNILENRDVLGGLNGVYKITDDLILNTRLGLNYRMSDNEMFAYKTSSIGRVNNGRMTSGQAEQTTVTLESFLNYSKTIGNHKISGLLGVGYEDFTTSNTFRLYNDFTFDDLGPEAIQLANDASTFRSSKSNYTIQSGFFRLGYTLLDRYIFTVNGRADGTSKFVNGEPWGFFPSAAVAWIASEESFFKEIKGISQLKFRLSYGETGSQFGVGPLSTQGVYRIDKIPLSDDKQYIATFPAGVSNPSLTWETSRTLNLGMDLSFFRNKLRTNIDIYKRNTDRLLTQLQIPSQTGFNRVPVNAGELENFGVEIEVAYDVIRKTNFSWTTKLNWSKNTTKIVSLGLNEFIDSPPLAANFFGIPGSRNYPGAEVGLFYGFNIIGLIQPGDLVDYANGNFNIRTVPGSDANGNPTQVPLYPTTGGGAGNNRPGMWIFEDVNKDGVINIDDRKVLGNPNPDFFFGWNNNFTMGNFNVSMFFQGSYGNDILNLNKAFVGIGWNGANSTQEWYNKRWTLENQHNDVNWPSGQGPRAVDAPTSVFVEDGSYVRLKNFTVRYNFARSNGPSRFAVYATATNLLTLTRYSGIDPEVDILGGNPLLKGVDYAAYPRPKTYSVGLNINL